MKRSVQRLQELLPGQSIDPLDQLVHGEVIEAVLHHMKVQLHVGEPGVLHEPRHSALGSPLGCILASIASGGEDRVIGGDVVDDVRHLMIFPVWVSLFVNKENIRAISQNVNTYLSV